MATASSQRTRSDGRAGRRAEAGPCQLMRRVRRRGV